MNKDKILNKVKLQLIYPDNVNSHNSPVFYTSILFALKHKWDDVIPTAGVDGRNLFINSAWFCALTLKQQLGLLAHECLHIAYRHIDSFKDHNKKIHSDRIEHRLYNMAGDHVINLGLRKAGYELPPNGLADTRFYGMSTLQVYNILHDEYTDDPSNFDLMDDTDIIVIPDDGTAKTKRDQADLADHITHIVAKAVEVAKMGGEGIGAIPSEVLRTLDIITNPRLPFEIILANYMNRYSKDDYSYRKPNKRFLPDFYLPSTYSETLSEITLAFDTSGSVSQEELNSFANGARIISETLKPEKMTLIEFDTQIHSVREIDNFTDIMQIEFHGGGGTYIGDVLEWAEENQPEVLLLFSDGWFNFPEVKPACDVIWIIHDNKEFNPPYGKTFHYKL